MIQVGPRKFLTAAELEDWRIVSSELLPDNTYKLSVIRTTAGEIKDLRSNDWQVVYCTEEEMFRLYTLDHYGKSK